MWFNFFLSIFNLAVLHKEGTNGAPSLRGTLSVRILHIFHPWEKSTDPFQAGPPQLSFLCLVGTVRWPSNPWSSAPAAPLTDALSLTCTFCFFLLILFISPVPLLSVLTLGANTILNIYTQFPEMQLTYCPEWFSKQLRLPPLEPTKVPGALWSRQEKLRTGSAAQSYMTRQPVLFWVTSYFPEIFLHLFSQPLIWFCWIYPYTFQK